MGGNIPGANFLGGSFPGGISPGGNLIGGNFPSGVFLIPFHIQFIQSCYSNEIQYTRNWWENIKGSTLSAV